MQSRKKETRSKGNKKGKFTCSLLDNIWHVSDEFRWLFAAERNEIGIF